MVVFYLCSAIAYSTRAHPLFQYHGDEPYLPAACSGMPPGRRSQVRLIIPWSVSHRFCLILWGTVALIGFYSSCNPARPFPIAFVCVITFDVTVKQLAWTLGDELVDHKHQQDNVVQDCANLFLGLWTVSAFGRGL